MRPSKEIEEASLINSLVRASSSRYQAEIQRLHPSQVAHRATNEKLAKQKQIFKKRAEIPATTLGHL